MIANHICLAATLPIYSYLELVKDDRNWKWKRMEEISRIRERTIKRE